MLLDHRDCVLLIVDWQEALTPAVLDAASVRASIHALLDGARRFEVPVRVSEHMAGKIGATEPALRTRLNAPEIMPKTHFALPREPGALEALRALGRPRIVICGAEAHVCVLQTALALSAAGFIVLPVADAVASRREGDREAALARFRHHGLQVVTVEMVLFEWIAEASGDDFRALLPIIKSRG